MCSLEFNVLNHKPIYLTGEIYLLSGEIHVDSSYYPQENEFSRSIIVEIWQNEGAFIDMINNFKLVSSANGPRNISVYQYTHSTNLEDEMFFVLRDKRNASEKNSFERSCFIQEVNTLLLKLMGAYLLFLIL